MGTALARALHSCGYEITAVVSRKRSHARRAAELVTAHPQALTPDQLDKLPTSDILLITTPDDVIETVAEELAIKLKKERDDEGRRFAVALHTSGALSSEVLRSLRRAGLSVGSMHPLVSVNDPVHGASSLRSAFFCIEGEEVAVRVARKVVRALGAESFSIARTEKALYHAAAVMASGHVTALFDIAVEMLKVCGLRERRARAILLPLVRSALENLSTGTPAQALTGTFARADLATVKRHLKALNTEKMSDALAAYVLLGKRSLQLAQRAGVRPDVLKEIERALTNDK